MVRGSIVSYGQAVFIRLHIASCMYNMCNQCGLLKVDFVLLEQKRNVELRYIVSRGRGNSPKHGRVYAGSMRLLEVLVDNYVAHNFSDRAAYYYYY